MSDASARFALPMLAAGQAQKEVLHNEALIRVDALLHPLIESFGDDVPPGAPEIGLSWLVGAAPVGDWAGQAGALATWTDGGWRFCMPVEGMTVRMRGSGLARQLRTGGWSGGEVIGTGLEVGGVPVVGPRRPAIPTPAGGATVDGEARAALAGMLDALRAHGLIES